MEKLFIALLLFSLVSCGSTYNTLGEKEISKNQFVKMAFTVSEGKLKCVQ
jgi:hypothetical protein